MTERKKIMLLSLTVPWVALATVMISLHVHGAFLKGLVAVFALAMAILLVYVVTKMVQLKRSRR
jgi:energy-coupling factor transporter transmembrane protein EcfT